MVFVMLWFLVLSFLAIFLSFPFGIIKLKTCNFLSSSKSWLKDCLDSQRHSVGTVKGYGDFGFGDILNVSSIAKIKFRGQGWNAMMYLDVRLTGLYHDGESSLIT